MLQIIENGIRRQRKKPSSALSILEQQRGRAAGFAAHFAGPSSARVRIAIYMVKHHHELDQERNLKAESIILAAREGTQ